MKISKLKPHSPDFPEYLRRIAGAPKQLYVLGNLAPLLELPRLAVIGSRKVSPYGRQVTQQLAGEVAGRGVVIISGLALGVDGIAHQAALDAGGKTIAVLPSGLDTIYPATHRQLAINILKQGGAIISEYPEGTEAYKTNFIERNRLVSGLSDGVLITEAAVKSGTLHTANFALEQGKTVMAVPGNITNQLSAGTNNLIKSGAIPITQSADILNALGIDSSTQTSLELLGADEAETVILQLLANGVSDGAELMHQSSLKAADFNQALTMLEINGRIRPLGAGHWGLV